MTSLIIFIVSGLLIVIMLIAQYIRLRMSPAYFEKEKEYALNHPVKRFFFGFNRDSIAILFRVIYRIVTLVLGSIGNLIRGRWGSFLSGVRANDVRKEKGAVSFYLKHVSLDKKSRTEN
jgi:hypothetical protein